VRLSVAAAILCVALPAGAETVVTRCSTETVHLPVNLQGVPVDVRRIGVCSDDQPDDALWFLDRLDSIDGSLDGHFDRTGSGAGALVYVLDTGVEINHDEFAGGNVIAGIDVQHEIGVKSYCNSPNGALHPCFDLSSVFTVLLRSHGTGVASLIGGARVGVAPGVSMISVTAIPVPPDTPSSASELENWLAVFNAVIRTAWDPSTPNVRTAIISMSVQLAGSDAPAAYAPLVQKIRDMVGGVDRNGNPDPNGKRFLFVIFGGNTGDAGSSQCDASGSVRLFPATLGPSVDGLITVGGIGRDNRLSSISCRGPALELLAPSDDILPAINSGHDHYRKTLSTGTSYATPIVSGAAAQILAREPDLSPAEVEQRLEATPSFIIDAPDGTTSRVVHIFFPSRPRRRAVR
jgi:subtilisin family serine protease